MPEFNPQPYPPLQEFWEVGLKVEAWADGRMFRIEAKRDTRGVKWMADYSARAMDSDGPWIPPGPMPSAYRDTAELAVQSALHWLRGDLAKRGGTYPAG